MIRLDIITGFLGAGKTTLINKLLAEDFAGERVAVVENEFGEIGIDGNLIASKNEDLQVTELSNGCICCSLRGDFLAGLDSLIKEFKPNRIIIEPTGLAQTRDLEDACLKAEDQHGVRLSSITTVVSAPLLPALIEVGGEILLEQIVDARFIVLSAVQDLEPDDLPLAELIPLIRKFNPHALIHTEPWDETDGLTLLALAEEAFASRDGHADFYGASDSCQEQKAEVHHHEGHEEGSPDHEEHDTGYTSMAIRTNAPFDEAMLAELTAACTNGSFGEVIRAKALLNSSQGPIHYDYVLGTMDIGPINGPTEGKVDGRIVIIGRHLIRTRYPRFWKAR